jgi:hypothetical protein
MGIAFEASDDTALLASALGTGILGGLLGAKPAAVSETFGALRSDVPTRWAAIALLGSTAAAVLARDADAATKKNLLKATGVAWSAAAVQAAYDARRGAVKHDIGYGGAAASAAIGGFALFRGFQD